MINVFNNLKYIKIKDFFPLYPRITDNTIYQKINDLKEFNELKLNKDPEKVGLLFKSQEFITRFLSSITLYDGILLFHQTGTGKTCAFFGAIENIRQHNTFLQFDQAIIISPTPTIKNNLQEKLVTTCSLRYKNKITKDTNLNKFFQKDPFYSFMSITETNSYAKLARLINKYKSVIIVIDEIHKFTERDNSNFKPLFQLLHNTKYKKVILGTATPMVNNYRQIFNIMSLITPLTDEDKKELDLKKNIIMTQVKLQKWIDDKVNDYIKKDYIKMVKISKDKQYIETISNNIINQFRGRVSYLKKSDEIKIVNKSNWNNKYVFNSSYDSRAFLKFFKQLYYCDAVGLQLKTYNKINPLTSKSDNIKKYCGIKESKGFGFTLDACKLNMGLFVFPKLVLNRYIISEQKFPIKKFIGIDKLIISDSNKGFRVAADKNKVNKVVDILKRRKPSKFSIDTFDRNGNNIKINENSFEIYSVDEKTNEPGSMNSFNKYIEIDEKNGNYSFKKMITQYQFEGVTNIKAIMRPLLKDVLMHKVIKNKNRDNNILLKNLKKFSVKYYYVIKNIIAQIKRNGDSIINPRPKSLIYIDKFRGSGAAIFGLILELFGYERYNSKKSLTTKKMRYISVYSELFKGSTRMGDLINEFNKEQNNRGEFIQIIIGGRKIEEGIDLLHLRHVHIMAPFYNYTHIVQTLGRAIRTGSHYGLPNDEKQVDIYKYVLISPNETILNNVSDIKLYELSIYKDLSIKKMEYFLKRAAINCELFKNRNQITNNTNDYTRECEYMKCEYSCDYITENETKINNPNKLFFMKSNNFNKQIVNIFKSRFRVNLYELLIIFNIDDQSYLDLINNLYIIIKNKQPIINKYGFINYLNEYNNIYFLTREPIMYDDNITDIYYTKYPSIHVNRNLINEKNNVLNFNKYLIRSIQYVNDEFGKDTKWNEISNNIINYHKKIRGSLSQISYKPQEVLLKTCVIINKYNINVKPRTSNLWNYLYYNYYQFLHFTINNNTYIRIDKEIQTINEYDDPCEKILKRYTTKYEKLLTNIPTEKSMQTPNLYFTSKLTQDDNNNINKYNEQIQSKIVNSNVYGILTHDIIDPYYYKLFNMSEMKKGVKKIIDKANIAIKDNKIPNIVIKGLPTGLQCKSLNTKELINFGKLANINLTEKANEGKCAQLFNHLKKNNLIYDKVYKLNKDKLTGEFVYITS